MRKKLMVAALVLILSAGAIFTAYKADKSVSTTGITVAEELNSGIIEPPNW